MIGLKPESFSCDTGLSRILAYPSSPRHSRCACKSWRAIRPSKERAQLARQALRELEKVGSRQAVVDALVTPDKLADLNGALYQACVNCCECEGSLASGPIGSGKSRASARPPNSGS